MLYKEYIKLSSMSIHRIGSKANQEGIELSNHPVAFDDELSEMLKAFFLTAFKEDERYSFCHTTSLELNAVYSYVSAIFENRVSFHEQSSNLAKYLYERSGHPNIKSGDFYVCYFRDCILDGETVDAIGLFKSENKETIIQINSVDGGFSIESQSGMSINKLDKGCLVFNQDRESGYVVCVVDNANRSEAKYWVNDFLQLSRRLDDYSQTEQVVSVCKDFISLLSEEYDKATRAVMMNKVVESLGEESVSIDLISNNAFAPMGVSESFLSYVDGCRSKKELSVQDEFNGRIKSVNRRSIRNITKIRLDSNFEINILGGEENIVRGYDEERGQRYYKLFFDREK